ncbi:Hint domain-containing protein [Pseudogemmobacter sonorensis]|uniref:Hint domain-containing protein n=1 Tax=Pseudogemmobacter sonorensis TaxID=2989681 RepID=UPI0036CF250B
MGDMTLSFGTLEGLGAETGLDSPRGLTAGTTVLTLDGALPVQFLSPGDRVVTRNGARELVAVEVAVLRGQEMVRISAASLGHDRPEADLFVAPGQKILVRDWRAKALYGKPAAMVAAERLADGSYIRKETVAEVRLFTLRFARDEVIYAAGLELCCEAAPVHA